MCSLKSRFSYSFQLVNPVNRRHSLTPKVVDKMKLPRGLLASFGVIVFLIVLAGAGSAQVEDIWLPLDLKDPGLQAPTVDKDADAEGIFWDVVVDDAAKEGLAFNNYVRLKVFNDRGATSQSKIDIRYRDPFRIDALQARTIKPDGSIVAVKPEDIFERTLVQANETKIKVKSFVMPALQAGSIIEYRWREVAPRHVIALLRLPFQREIPMRKISYHFRQNPRMANAALRMAYFHMPTIALVPEANSFYRVELTNVPAFLAEPKTPPEDAVRSWALVYYVTRETGLGDEYWLKLTQSAFKIVQPLMSGGDDVRRIATETIGNATDADEKLSRLFAYCRDHIKNIRAVDSGLSESDIENRKANKKPADTLNQNSGSRFEINLLFAALAKAAGFDARIAFLADRSETFFDRSLPVSYFLNSVVVAVHVNETWRFFDPGSLYVPYGMLRWQQEFESALITDPAKIIFVSTPLSSPAASAQVQKAMLKLNEDGTVEGDVTIEYSGHQAVAMRLAIASASAVQREETFRAAVRARIAAAEISNVECRDIDGWREPLACSYHVRVLGYAQRSGKSLFMKPAFFRYGIASLFPSSTRVNDVYFNYPWSERDDVTIDLPKGYRATELERIRPYDMGPIGAYKAELSASSDGGQIRYQRNFSFGGGGRLLFFAADYGGLKDYFDVVQKRDDVSVLLRPADNSNGP